MAVQNAQVTVTTSATRLDQTTDAGNRSAVLVRNRGSVSVFLGNATVTTANGLQLDPTEAVSVDLKDKREALYGIVTAGTCRVDVLQADT